MAEHRTAPRSKKRLPCVLRTEDRRHSALVLDVSATGVFVQTGAALKPGTELVLELNPPGRDPLVLKGAVARKKVVPMRLKAVEQGGIGVHLSQPPEEWFRLVAELQQVREAEEGPAEEPAPEAPPPPRRPSAAFRRSPLFRAGPAIGRRAPTARERAFRVRIKQTEGSRSRFLEIRAPSEDEARRRALAEVGDGWQVLSCEQRSA